MDPVQGHLGQWWNVALWIVMFGLFIAFTPFYKKSQRKPSSVYLAFIVAMAFEMFGIPMSMYIIAWLFGSTLPDGILWGHTLVGYIGLSGMYVAYPLIIGGIILVVLGWKEVYKRYWSKETGKGELITNGIYNYIRHPQYTGFLMITLGMLFDWATLPMLIMWPVMAVLYYRLAIREEKDMLAEFGEKYTAYMNRTGRLLPRLPLGRRSTQATTSV